MESTPIAIWIVDFFEDIHDFLLTREWIVALIEEIYLPIVDQLIHNLEE
jgi:hypothetical protein